MASSPLLLAATSALTTALFLLVDIVFLVLIVTTIRRQRPDAWGLLAAAVGVALLTNLLNVVSGLVGSMFVSGSGGMESFIHYTAASHLLLTMTGITARILLVIGVLRLARDPFVPPPGPRF
jgi:hypothetical protein